MLGQVLLINFVMCKVFLIILIMELGIVLLIILVMNVRQSPLLWIPLHFIPSSDHQAVHHIHGVVSSTFQNKPGIKNKCIKTKIKIYFPSSPAIRTVQQTRRITTLIFMLQDLPVTRIKTWKGILFVICISFSQVKNTSPASVCLY